MLHQNTGVFENEFAEKLFFEVLMKYLLIFFNESDWDEISLLLIKKLKRSNVCWDGSKIEVMAELEKDVIEFLNSMESNMNFPPTIFN